ncbi:TonB-dependent receptor [Sphingobium sp.]|uniref:TonB-dependent receptor n=1 Tax=Sphingobium sp. TaxID=1912891 RepID=UPI0028BE5DED|nr:TonB-dependent receptor [Sphingobium sp.]
MPTYPPRYRTTRTKAVAASVIAMAAWNAAPALAQETAPQSASAQASENQGGLRDIIVTARKRQESAQNIPVAVTALSSDELVNRNIRTIEQVATSVPQFTVARGSSGSGANLSLRGIGSNFTSIGIEQSVSVNVDGVYYGQGRILNEGLFDMAQVEILKGPQALFFGKNSTAGALSFTTADPGQKTEIIGRAGYEFRTHEKYLEGIVSGPLSDTLSARLAVRWSDMDRGYMKNQAVGGPFKVNDVANGGAQTVYNVPPSTRYGPMEENINIRGTLKFQPTDKFTITLKGGMSDRNATSAGFLNELFRCPVGGTSQLQPGNECNKDWKGYWDDLPSELVSANPLLGRKNGQLYDDYRSYTATATVKYDTDVVNFNWVNGYQKFDNQFSLKSDATTNANRGTYAGTGTKYEAYSTEFRAQTDLKFPVNFLIGLYYQASKLNFQQDIIFPGTAAAGHAIDTSVTDPALVPLTVRKLGHTDGATFALFGQLLWDIVPTLQMTAGGRLTSETKDSTFRMPYVNRNLRAVYRMYDPANPLSEFVNHQKFDNFSPEVTLTWKPSSRLTVYGAYKTGYKSGGFSISGLNTVTTSVDDLAFGPETVEGFEAGIRSKLFNNSVRLNLTAFHYDYKNLQVDFFNSAITTFVTFNAGTARTQGLELDGEWAPRLVPGLTLRGALAYTDAKYTDFPGAPCYAGQRPAMGCLAPTTAIPYVHQNLDGVHTQLAPKWAGTLGIDYETDIGSALKGGLLLNLRYSDRYLVSPFGNPVDVQKSFATLDATLRVGAQNDRWQLALIGKNLTNRYVLNAAQDAPSTGSGTGTIAGVPADQYGFPAPPRTVALQLTVRY